jgi:hypothetical protein
MQSSLEKRVVHFRGLAGLCLCGVVGWLAPAQAGELDPPSPAAFFPGGMLGVQIGSSWETSKKSMARDRLACQRNRDHAEVFDEICFFKTTGRVAGADIHDGFIVRKGDRLVLIGTGITIKDADDPLAESVMRDFESEVHAKYQQTGGDVLFVTMPEKHMTAGELAGYAQTAPVLLIELEPKDKELAVLYGYLAPVNAFSALASE